MATRKPSPQGLVSQADGGLWMKMDSNPVTDHTETPLATCGEKPQEETKVLPPAPAVITRYYSVMDDEGADDVFIPHPPPYTAPFLPTEGSTGAQVNNSSVTLANGAADATEAEDNPSGLDWHHGEKQLMAAQKEADEVTASTAQTSKESMDTVSLSKDGDSTLPKDQDQTSMEETCCDPSGRHNKGNRTGHEESKEPEDTAIVSEGQEKCRESEADKDKYPKQVHFDKEGGSKDICGLAEKDSENVNNVATNAATVSGLPAGGEDFESRVPPEVYKCNQNTMDAATHQSQVKEIPPKVSSEDGENVDTRSLNYTLTKHNWVRRESGETRRSLSEGEMATKDEQEDRSRRISTDIQQGDHLLQRLQLVQLRQDVPDGPHTFQQVVQETRGETKGMIGTEEDDLKADLTGGDEKEEVAKTNLMEKEKNERNESKDADAKARMPSSTMPVETEHNATARAEAGDSDDDQRSSWVPVDLSAIDSSETSFTQIPFLSVCHRLSVVETTIERQIHEEAQGKQNLQRAGGIVDLTDNPDVLEIPFKSNISLEPLPAKDSPDQRSDWQFSEQKMKKEISQDIQRELVLVNLGKIPGGYSKGEVRELKETKMLFEAFHQDNTEGPTRHRKTSTSPMKGHVYPSVLERTRSLEMLSQKTYPVSRTHSLRLSKDTEKSPEILRSVSPTGGSRDKTRLSPYAKQDKNGRLYRSMDSITTDVSTSAVELGCKMRKGNVTQESPILKHNPFFKLRPALALQPEVEKDIREAREREEELRRQRCTLYGENIQPWREDGEKMRFKPKLVPDVGQQSRGKLERVWPPPSKKDQLKSEQTQEPKVHRAGGQKAPLWQRWETGLINGKPSDEDN